MSLLAFGRRPSRPFALLAGDRQASLAMSGSTAADSGYRPQLDTLRAAAVLAVLLDHTMADNAVVRFIAPGALGVDLFFVLSGFLISRILFGTIKAGNLKPFYARRALRIMPLYYLVLLCTAIVGWSSLGLSLPFHAAFLSNWWFFYTGAWHGLTAHFWTLGVEEQFYLVWPLLLAKTPTRYWKIAVAGLVLGGVGTRVALLLTQTEGFAFALPTYHLDLFGLGAALGLWLHHAKPSADSIRRIALASIVSGILVLALVARWHGTAFAVAEKAFGVTGIGLVNVGLVALAFVGLTGSVGQIASWPPLLFLGRISYGVYAWHLLARLVGQRMITMAGVEPSTLPSSIALFVITTALAIALASASFYLFEARLLEMKHRFPYRPANPDRS